MQVEPQSLSDLGIPISFESIVDSVITAGAYVTVIAFIFIAGFALVNKLFTRQLEAMGVYEFVGQARTLIREYNSAPGEMLKAKSRFIDEFGERSYKRLKVNEKDVLKQIRSGKMSTDIYHQHVGKLTMIKAADRKRRMNHKKLETR